MLSPRSDSHRHRGHAPRRSRAAARDVEVADDDAAAYRNGLRSSVLRPQQYICNIRGGVYERPEGRKPLDTPQRPCVTSDTTASLTGPKSIGGHNNGRHLQGRRGAIAGESEHGARRQITTMALVLPLEWKRCQDRRRLGSLVGSCVVSRLSRARGNSERSFLIVALTLLISAAPIFPPPSDTVRLVRVTAGVPFYQPGTTNT